MFLKLTDIWENQTYGAVIMSNVVTTGRGWEKELEQLLENNEVQMMKTTNPFKILVLSGTHGKKDTHISGFTNKGSLEKEFYLEDMGIVKGIGEFVKINTKTQQEYLQFYS